MKVRQNLYIDRSISDALEALASRPGGNKSHLVNDALADWLARRGTREIDDLLKTRLDRMSRELTGARRDLEVLLESLSLFVRYQLTVTAPLPDTDSAARAVGRDRFAVETEERHCCRQHARALILALVEQFACC